MLRLIGSVAGLAFLMVACGGGDSGGGTIPAPSGLTYSGPTMGVVGTDFGPDKPTVTGTVDSYSVRPALPAGLSLDQSAGVISGTPLAASPATTYTITAHNPGGTAAFALTLTVVEAASALSYASPVTATVGVALTRLLPTFQGVADGFTVVPALPAGLSLDPSTGVVAGTPQRARIPATYTITASLKGVPRATFDLLLSVDAPPAGTAMTGGFRAPTVIGLGYVSGAHSGLTDESGKFTYESGQGITFSVGQVSVGTVLTAKGLITPVDLVALGTSESNQVLNVARFLMMLDQDNDPLNGIQISAAVSGAAASWAPVDFNTTDLPTTVASLIQQASAADAVTHKLPDATSAQALLRADFYCTYSGSYDGSYAADLNPGDHGGFRIEVFPDASIRSWAYSSPTLAGFGLDTAKAMNPLLDATFALDGTTPIEFQTTTIDLRGSFADPTYLSGTYLADTAGSFEAASDVQSASTYKFVGKYLAGFFERHPAWLFMVLGMDESNHVSGSIGGDILQGTVTGTAFVGTAVSGVVGQDSGNSAVVSGTFAKTTTGYTLAGHYIDRTGEQRDFSTVGCRAN